MKILIVGAGNIGKRHLESLSKFNKIKQFYIVEKNNLNVQTLKKKFTKKNFFFFKKINNLEKGIRFDLVIISTNSDIRFKIFEDLVKGFKVNYFILEKFVFQNIDHFNYASKLIKDKKLKVFINCPMRIWPFFKKIKDKDYKSNIKVLVKGSKWGLASNAIHYIDLLIFLTKQNKVFISKKKEISIYKSKRKKFIEFSGRLDVKIDKNNSLIMIDDHKENFKPEMTIKLENIFYDINADRDYYYVKKFKIKQNTEKKLIYKKIFKTPLQSQLTLKIFKDILFKKKHTIPRYEDLFRINKLLIKLFLNIYKKKVIDKKQNLDCPIT